MKRLLLITIASLAIMSCGNRGSQDNSSTSTPELADSSAVKTLESFLNIDYEKAFAESDSTSEQYPDFSSDFFSVDTDNREPIIIFVSVPDCSACIASTLDFITTYSHADTELPPPLIALKEGDSDIFDFYQDKVAESADSITKAMLNDIYVLCGDWPSVNNAPDGAYLVYRNRVIAHLPWSPL
ncbi:MAG TPA: hypothetical protein IAB96_03230 [Candidatus Coprenecus pullicola]|nr:hypothetical protein [Candidatus Coprenecus pullicola]